MILSPPNLIARDFSAAATHYDDFAALQREIADTLLAQMPPELEQKSILDAGAGTGYICRRYSAWIGLDIAEGMCRQQPSSTRTICADMQQLPLAADSVAGVSSSLAMQWLENPLPFLQEAYRITQPAGHLMLATLVSGTLAELRAAYAKAGMADDSLLPFCSASEIAAAVREAGWVIQTQKQSLKYTHYPHLSALMRQLKGLGARQKERQSQGLKGRGWLAALEAAYGGERLQASWQVLFLIAQKDG